MSSLLSRRCLATLVTARPKRVGPKTARPPIPSHVPQVPRKRGDITTPTAFLQAIGRNEHDKFKVDDNLAWDRFFHYESSDLKAAGVPARDRRYILWAMQQYRMGKELKDFVHEVIKKKFRGWGPSVQNGKLLRSKRHALSKIEQLKLTMHGPIMPPNQVAKLAQLKREEEERRKAVAR